MRPFFLLVAGLAVAAPLCSPAKKQSVYVPLNQYFNNKGIGKVPGEANYDGLGNAYVGTSLPQGGYYNSTKTGISYLFPGYQSGNASDNVIMSGQVVELPEGEYFSVHMLIASDTDSSIENVTFTYTDGSTALSEVRASPYSSFLSILSGEIISPSYFTHNSTNFNSTHIFEFIAAMDPMKTLSSVTLPDTSQKEDERIHLFSLSLWEQSGVQIQYVRPTQKQATEGVQTVELIIDNAGPAWISGAGVEVSIHGYGIRTVQPGYIKRLRPGDQKKINVGVTGCGTVNGSVTLKGSMNATFTYENVKFGLEDFSSDLDSIAKHESPDWFNEAKYGIFIHWGVYAVPGWGNSTPWEIYAEWYWWYGHHRIADKADVYNYHLRTYGPDVVYDDFFSNFTAENWDAKSWVDLFADAGAQYFVLTTKHHDGFALFDTEDTTHRNSLHYGPKRDILKELFDAAKRYQPQLKRGTYFSLPEWFNPLYGKYGFSQFDTPGSTTWPGIIANNPYTQEVEPYTGATNVSDFIDDLMVPQMEMLAYNYETDIMWCDCGGANGTGPFAAEWFNNAASSGRQVAINNRCGLAVSDFDTPEYSTFSSISERKWESNQGMDPYSYGYNRATPPELYMNATTLVGILVDMVSKNGNLLLDVGPKADGTIDVTQVAHLLEAGIWIKANAEAIFNTSYYFVGAEDPSGNLRFTQTTEAIYVISLVKPAETLLVDVPLPIMDGDVVTMIGAGNGTEVEWKSAGRGIEITVPMALIDAGSYAWVFKITYAG
ncbi:hypothetical protein HYFRA_00007713 [Hymenoscyphus fraxineus]|uniref:alpha-L-fucosidase n=1 Tax=Hymenoscyphus fraxineus TaxID=746836 RepID=A0A9N9KMM5_9HELO|nr:hypothetical protein HYFRA_00007713 [Hymenoscyphus fraxineus]